MHLLGYINTHLAMHGFMNVKRCLILVERSSELNSNLGPINKAGALIA